MCRQNIGHDQFIIFFRAEYDHAFTRLKFTNEEFVRDDVERLPIFALPIALTHRAKRAIESGCAQLRRDALGRAGDGGDDPTERMRGVAARSAASR